MNSKFFDLKQEKQDRMINAALKIFAENGYNHASTDDIVKEARISKGLLFHYFESKIGVYSFIYDYCTKYMTLELSSAVDPSEDSYFVLRKQIEAAKMQALKSYPYLTLFLESCKHEMVPEAAMAIEESKVAFESALNTILSKADMAPINAATNSSAILKMLDYTLYGLLREKFLNNEFNAEMLYKESVAYIDLIANTL